MAARKKKQTSQTSPKQKTSLPAQKQKTSQDGTGPSTSLSTPNLPGPEDLAVLASAWIHEGAGCGAHPAGCQDQPCRIARRILGILGQLYPIPKPLHKVDTCQPCEAVRRARNTRPRKRSAK